VKRPTRGEARRIAVNVARLRDLLRPLQASDRPCLNAPDPAPDRSEGNQVPSGRAANGPARRPQTTPIVQSRRGELETRGMWNHFLIGVLALATGFGLIMIGRPRQGDSPRFLRFNSAPMVYLPAVMVFIAIGIVELFTWALATN